MIGILGAYLRQRCSLRVFAPVVGVLTALACWTTASPLVSAVAGRAAMLTIGIVILLRVWDDIEDRGSDRVAHPDRVLPQHSVRVFLTLQAVLAGGLTGVLLWSGSRDAALGLLGLVAAACLAYRVARPRLNAAAWPYVLLLKYPATIAVVAHACGQPRLVRLLTAMLLTYAGACAYEELHTRIRRPHSSGVTA